MTTDYSAWPDALALALVIAASYFGHFMVGWAELIPDLVVIYDGWILLPEDMEMISNSGCDAASLPGNRSAIDAT